MCVMLRIFVLAGPCVMGPAGELSGPAFPLAGRIPVFYGQYATTRDGALCAHHPGPLVQAVIPVSEGQFASPSTLSAGSHS